MRLLFIGGTRFVGRHTVEAALARGCDVTLFHRGTTQPDLFPDVTRVLGDRDEDLGRLDDHAPWDAVIDTCAYHPKHVQKALDALSARTQRYVLISTISVYAELDVDRIDHTSPLAELEGDLDQPANNSTYGPYKALCERACIDRLGDRATVLRPGLIVGPHDPTDRFTYWPLRFQRGGDILAPGDPDVHIQCIDARDLAAWILDLIEADQGGVFNAVGPSAPTTFRDMLQLGLGAPNDAAPTVHWTDDAFLKDHDVSPFHDLPLWLPHSARGLLRVDTARAQAHGLRTRPLRDTWDDTLAWALQRDADAALKAGLTPEREREMLDAWQARVHEA